MKAPFIRADEILSRSPRVLRILQRISTGEPCKDVARAEGVRGTAVGHVLRVLRIRREWLAGVVDKSEAGIVAYLNAKGGAV